MTVVYGHSPSHICGGSRGSDHCACLTGSDRKRQEVTWPEEALFGSMLCTCATRSCAISALVGPFSPEVTTSRTGRGPVRPYFISRTFFLVLFVSRTFFPVLFVSRTIFFCGFFTVLFFPVLVFPYFLTYFFFRTFFPYFWFFLFFSLFFLVFFRTNFPFFFWYFFSRNFFPVFFPCNVFPVLIFHVVFSRIFFRSCSFPTF